MNSQQQTMLVGRVMHGEGYGKQLGFPTANLDRRQYARRKMKIRLGVYAGHAELIIKKSKLKIFPAGIVIGPLDKHHLPKIEAHLLGFKGNLYNKKLTLILKKYLRNYRKFKTPRDLKRQMRKDLALVKKLNININ